MNGRWARGVLVVWTLGIWGSRVRNIAADDDLTGVDRLVSLGIAGVLLCAAVAVAFALWTHASWLRLAVGALVVVGVARWTVRGPIILLSDEWETGFKVVHTILWLVTVVLSIAAWREQSASSQRQHDVAAGAR